MKRRHAAIFAALAASLVSPAASALAGASAPTTVQMLDEATRRLQAKDAAETARLIRAAIAAGDFVALPEHQRHRAYSLLGAAAMQLKRDDEAKDALRKATAMPQADLPDWALRLQLSSRQGDTVDTAVTMVKIAENWPYVLRQVDGAAVIRLIQALPVQRQKLDLLNALHRANYAPSDPAVNFSRMWKDYALLLLERGEPEAARQVVMRVTASDEPLIEIRADKRFDVITAADRARFDPVRGAEAELALLQSAMKAHPDRLGLVTGTALNLLTQGRHEEGLALLDAAIAKADAADGAKAPFTDIDQLSWVMDTRARFLGRLGRRDEAVAEFEKAARLPDRGNPNISQSLNAATAYCWSAKPQDALRVLAAAPLQNASAYGKMELERTRFCAYTQLGDQEAAAKSMAYLKEHFKEGPGPGTEALLLANDLDALEAAWTRMLDESAGVMWFLRSNQAYRLPATATPLQAEVARRRDTALARPGVLQAVAKVGRLEPVALYRQTDY